MSSEPITDPAPSPKGGGAGGAASGRRHVVARADEIEEGGRMIVEVDGREIGIFRVDGKLYALRNHCPHRGGPLCTGEMLGFVESERPGDLRLDRSRAMLTCPWHGWEFDITTGQSYWNPRRSRARRFPVEQAAGADLAGELKGAEGSAPGPYVADLVSVEVEDEYVVLTTRGSA